MNFLESVDIEHGLCLDVVFVHAFICLVKFTGLMMCDVLPHMLHRLFLNFCIFMYFMKIFKRMKEIEYINNCGSYGGKRIN